MNIHTHSHSDRDTHTPYGFTHAISHETILHVRYTQKRHKDKSMDKRLHRTQLPHGVVAVTGVVMVNSEYTREPESKICY